ncbi:MAG TPA: hypothetical protein VEW42_02945 [Candidatus Eisenbacteria bacterium]|nr:hypothetical protein [Candidatus Eisenbacteria bacterium]
MPELRVEVPQGNGQEDAAPANLPVQKVSPLGEARDLGDLLRPREEKVSLRQREAMARCRVEVDSYMEKALTRNPDASTKEEMQRWVERKSRENGLTPRQIHEMNALAREYIRNNTLARELRETYKNDRELVRALTGMDAPSSARLSVRVGPWGLEISADDRTIQYLLNRGGPAPANFHAGGFALPENVPPYIFFRKQFFNKEILVHERQHAKYALNKHVLHRFHDYESSAPQYGLESMMRAERSLALERAKDEVFAYYLGQGGLPMSLFQAEDGNPYDYLKFERDYGRMNHSDPHYAQASERIYVHEYRKMLQVAVARFDGLIHRAGYSSDLAISLLIDIPLEQWDRKIGEILVEKGYAQQPAAHTFPTKGWGTVQVEDKQVPFVDVVILPQDSQPNWYRERSVGEGDSHQQSDQAASLSEIFSTENAMAINQLLYQQTREAANEYITSLSGEERRRYFQLLDMESKALSRIIPEGRPSRKQISEVVERILGQLKTYKPQPEAV